MTYNADLPPSIVRTDQTEGPDPDTWELRDGSGNTIETYNRVGMSVEVWWGDILQFMRENSGGQMSMIEDATLLMVRSDWEIVS